MNKFIKSRKILCKIRSLIKHWEENTKIKKKLAVSYFALVSLAILSITFLSYIRINTVLLALAKENARYSILQLEENIENRLGLYEEISKSVFFNKELIDLITKRYSRRLEAYDAFVKGRSILDTLKVVDSNISRISVQLFNSSFLSDGEYFILADEKNTTSLFDEMMHTNTGKLWTSTYKNWKKKDVIALYTLLYEFKMGFHVAGILQIEIPQKIIHEYIEAESNNKDIYILHSNGHVITASDKTIIGDNLVNLPYIKRVFKNDSGEFVFNVNGHESLIVYNTMYNRWKIVYVIPLKNLMKDTSKLNYFILLICLITIAGLWVLTRLLAGKLTQRLNLLAEGVRKVGEGNYKNKINLTGSDEVGQLALLYNQMTEKLEYMFEEVYEANIKRKQAELWALQAQINPHFLYNSLSSLGWLALKRGVPELRNAAMDLAKFYRFSLSRGTDIITLHQEIEHIKTYVRIQRMRFGDKVHVSYNIEECLYDYKIMKLTLQPLVENCYNHAMREDESVLNIEIKGYVEGNHVVLEVIDDGVGMSEEQIINILAGSRNKYEDWKGYGIMNVDERIKLHFGPEYGISLNSVPGMGTIVRILLPFQQDV